MLESSSVSIITLLFPGVHRNWTRTLILGTHKSGSFLFFLFFIYGIYCCVGMHLCLMGKSRMWIWCVTEWWNLLHLSRDTATQKNKVIGPIEILCFPHGYFDGATANSLGGARFSLYLNHDHFFFYIIGSGPSTNTRDELLALWALLFTATSTGIPNLHVRGDSYVIINWMNSKSTPTPLNLKH